MTTHMQSFRNLLKPSSNFFGDDKLQLLFEESKHEIIKEIKNGVRILDRSRQTCLATDRSKKIILLVASKTLLL